MLIEASWRLFAAQKTAPQVASAECLGTYEHGGLLHGL